MPDLADILQYRHFRQTAFPFATAPSPTDTSPKYVAGSNLMTSYKGYTELRPGFDVGFERVPTSFTDPIKRIFTWRRWGGQFYIMLCTSGVNSQVWSLAAGRDSNFSLIFTSVSAETFDFVVSNNFCFFANGLDNKKFDGVSVTNWGIANPNVSLALSAYAGTAANGSTPTGGSTWSNVNGALGAPGPHAPATASVTSVNTIKYSLGLNLTNYLFSVPPGNTITGISVTVDGFQTSSGFPNSVGVFFNLLYNGMQIGTVKPFTFPAVQLPSSRGPITVGSSTDLWGAILNPNITNDTTFGVQVTGAVEIFGGTSTATFSVDSVQIVIYNTGGPIITVSGSAGTFSASNGGYEYVYCYFNSNTGHISSPTPPSQPSGNFTSKLNIGIPVIASTDPQVTNIRLFRTTDGGGGVYFEVSGSPYPNATGTITDNTADANLSIITAPTFGFNDPPPPQKGMVWFANRIWGFSNNTLYFTDWEEMNIGVPEEGSTSGPAGNFYKFASEITGLSVVSDGVLIFLAGSIWKISGDSLSTFWRKNISLGLGCRNRACISSLGGTTAFLANTNSIWTTDSNSLNEISQDIQPTLDNIDSQQASISFHFQGQYRWLLVCDPSHTQSIPFDLNTEKWMPPWSIVGNAVHSGETSVGTFTLLLGQQTSNKMLQMIPNQFTDNGSFYGASGTTNTLPLVNEHLSSGSPIIDLFYPQAPEHVAELEYLGMETNAVLPDSILRMFDDDPNTATYTDITANRVDSPLKTVVQGANVLDKWTYDRAWSGKRVSVQFNYNPTGQYFKLYTVTLAYKQVR
jgi:hypothetical protein